MFLNKLLFAALVALCATNANAVFLVDYQGLDKNGEKRRVTPAGFNVIADRTYKVVRQIGTGNPEFRQGFGLQLSLADSLLSIIPDNWVSYIDMKIKFNKPVDWDGDLPWTEVLTRLGNNYGLAFIVDWNQKMIQVVPGIDFNGKEKLEAVKVINPETGRTLYVHTSDALSDSGILIMDGNSYKVTMSATQ
ncbi:MAG: hypothetical protein QM504_15800 [Pseudomonadota bacterium]